MQWFIITNTLLCNPHENIVWLQRRKENTVCHFKLKRIDSLGKEDIVWQYLLVFQKEVNLKKKSQGIHKETRMI